MSTWEPSTLVAWDFALEETTFDINLVTATSTHTVTVPAGTYRFLLGDGSTDLLQVLTAVMNTPSPSLPGGVTFAVTLDANGWVRITCTGDTFVSDDAVTRLGLTDLGRILGVEDTITATSEFEADYGPWYTLIGAGYDGVEQHHPLVAAERTSDGRVIGWKGGSRHFSRKLTFDFIPLDINRAAEAEACPHTPWRPTLDRLGAVGSTTDNRPWSWMDNLSEAVGRRCAWTAHDLQALRSSTTERYLLGYVAPETLKNHEARRADPRWDRWVSSELELVTDGTSGTRA